MSVRIKDKKLLNLEWKEQTKEQVPYKTKTCKLTYFLVQAQKCFTSKASKATSYTIKHLSGRG